MLSIINKHVRDESIFFDEEPHIYYVNGCSDNISATTLIHKYFSKFDPDLAIQKMQKGKNWMNSQYYGMTPEEIKKMWKDNGIEASTQGTHMHKSIENYWNGLPYENESEEFKMFLNFRNDNQNLVPYRTEWEVYQEDYGICGSIDGVFINEDDTLDIADWKRTKNIETKPKFPKKGLKPVSHLYDTNFWHYSLQLNLYKFILESKYGKTIKNMYLVCLHPINSDYLVYPIDNLQKEIKDILNHHLQNK